MSNEELAPLIDELKAERLQKNDELKAFSGSFGECMLNGLGDKIINSLDEMERVKPESKIKRIIKKIFAVLS